MRFEATDISARRGGRLIFRGAGFGLGGGAVATLEGPNGSGKSTLLRALAGLGPVESGDAVVTDAGGRTSLRKDRDGYQERILYSGHLDAVKPALSVRENLVFWAELYASEATGAETGVDAALAAFDLESLADTPAAACSAGQKRRLGLARLAAISRPVWLLDEPTVSMDARSIERFAGLVQAHAGTGGIALIATHAAIGLTPTARIDMAAFSLGASPAEPTASGADDPFLEDGDWT